MTKQEAAIITAYTGYTLPNSFEEFHKYAEKLMGRTIYTLEFASLDLARELRKLSKNDFISMEVK